MPSYHSRFGNRPRTVFPHGPGGPSGPLACDACRIAVRTMLDALPARRRRLLTTPGTMVVLAVPSEVWVEPVRAHLHAILLGEDADTDAGWFNPEAVAIVMGRTQPWEPWPDVEEGLALAEEAGQTVIAVSHAPAACLPRQFVAVAHHVAVPRSPRPGSGGSSTWSRARRCGQGYPVTWADASRPRSSRRPAAGRPAPVPAWRP